jgi:hypothetical protein
VNRLKKSKVDTVLWYLPGVWANDVALRLADAGIRVLGIGDGSLAGIFCRYEVRREAAITAILHDWRSTSGITSVTVVRGNRSAAYEERLEAILDRENFHYEVVGLGNERIESL